MSPLLLAPVLLGPGCAPPPVPPSVPGVTVSTLPQELRGLSGLTADDRGRLWAVTERTPALVPLRLDGEALVLDGEPLLVASWPEGQDAESIAWTGPDRFAIGAEPRTRGERATDTVVEVVVNGTAATVFGVREVSYAPFGVLAEANRGLEGLAATPTALVAAAETILTPPTGREAPLWRLSRPGDAVGTARLRLTSDTGKISDVAARDEGDRTRIVALERHYAVARLVTADITWGTADTPTLTEATVLRDLAPLLTPMPNLEGLVWLPDGRVVLLADNDSGERPGPVVAVVMAGP